MKLLFDQNLSYKLCHFLAELFPDSQQVRQLSMDRSDDQTIFEYARVNDFTIVTKDADFSILSSLHGTPPKILWIRCHNSNTKHISSLIQNNAEAIFDFLNDPDSAILELVESP